jgi:uncharacterized membrane protein
MPESVIAVVQMVDQGCGVTRAYIIGVLAGALIVYLWGAWRVRYWMARSTRIEDDNARLVGLMGKRNETDDVLLYSHRAERALLVAEVARLKRELRDKEKRDGEVSKEARSDRGNTVVHER